MIIFLVVCFALGLFLAVPLAFFIALKKKREEKARGIR